MTGRLVKAGDRFGRCLAPVPAGRTRPAESAAVFALAFLIGFFRLGSTSLRGVVWGEDGSVFLQGAHEHSLWGVLFKPYRGYAHVVPRLIAEPISHLPLAWQGLAICVAAAVVQALVALLAYHVVRARLTGRFAAAMAALAVAAVPVGWEVVDNVANSQWFLLAAVVLAPLWSPSRWPGRIGSAVAMAAAAASSPFAAVGVALACLVALCRRTWQAAGIAAAGLAGLLAQAIVIKTSPQRPALGTAHHAGPLAPGFIRRVVGDATLGVARHSAPESPSVLIGLVVAAALVCGILVLARAGLRGQLVTPVVLLVFAFVVYALPVYLSNTDTAMVGPTRYYVASAILFLTAVAILAELAYTQVRRGPTVARVIFGAMVVAVAYGMGSSYQAPDDSIRLHDPGWAQSVDHARHACAKHPAGTAKIWQSPSWWATRLPCSSVLGSG